MAEQVHPALDEVVDDLEAVVLDDEDEAGGVVIVEESDGPPERRWVRYVIPVMGGRRRH